MLKLQFAARWAVPLTISVASIVIAGCVAEKPLLNEPLSQ